MSLAALSDATPALGVMIVDDQPQRRERLAGALAGAGYRVLVQLASADRLLLELERVRPDLVLIDLDSPGRDALESFSLIGEFNPTPILLSATCGDREFMAKAIQAGVCAYQADGLDASRVQPVFELALAQFQAFQALRQQLKETQAELSARKVIERAKGLLMAHQGVDEETAHTLLRKAAMDQGVRLEQVAEKILKRLGAVRRPAGG